jgi:diguanylate cyclase (GGDEF)-like protein
VGEANVGKANDGEGEQPVAQSGPERVSVERDLLEQVLYAHHRLQGKLDLGLMVDFLTVELPQRLGLPAAELQLADPDGAIAALLPDRLVNQRCLRLGVDPFDLESLYVALPQVEVVQFGDERMFRLLAWDDKSGGAVLMPLIESGHLVGSYHWGLSSPRWEAERADYELLRSLTQSISSTFVRVRQHQQADQFTLLDPVTGVSNHRGFRRALGRELARAGRFAQPISLLFLSLDEQADIASHYGEAACRFALKRVVQRLSSDLRETDSIARIAEDKFAVLLPSCSEHHGHDIAERMCRDVEDFAIDDGRGGALYSTLSIGVVTWTPEALPADNLERLSVLLQAEVETALAQSVLAGGNRVSIARLGALMV